MLHCSTLPATPATTSVPDVLVFPFLLDHTDIRGESEADDFAQSLPHFNPIHRTTHDFMQHLTPTSSLKSCGVRYVVKWQVRIHWKP